MFHSPRRLKVWLCVAWTVLVSSSRHCVFARGAEASLRGSSRALKFSFGNDSNVLVPPLLPDNDFPPAVQPKQLEDTSSNNNKLLIAGLFSSNNYEWIEIFDFTMSLLQDKNNGWHDDIYVNNEELALEWTVADSACDELTALQNYWDMRTNWTPTGRMHGVIGMRCSGPTIAAARVAGLEHVPVVSPSATAPRISDKDEFPFVSRLVAPTMIEAMISTLREFGWDRVSIIATDTKFASDLVTEFSRLWIGSHDDASGTWNGDIAYSHSVTLNSDGGVNQESVIRALDGVPTDDPTINSRIILLVAHDNHAYSILRTAYESRFQEDTIWMGLPSWIGRTPQDTTWIPPVPGYLGITQYRNKYFSQDFLDRLRTDQANSGRPVIETLPDYTAEYMVDSIVALVRALVSLPPELRRDGALVSSRLRSLKFEGISGPVSFTNEGDREDPQYSIMSFQENEHGILEWQNVGNTGVGIGSTNLEPEKICYAGFGCNLAAIPSDKYTVPKDKVATWVPVLMSLLVVLLLVIAALYYRNQRKRRIVKEKMKRLAKQLEHQMQGMVEIVKDLSVQCPITYQEKVEGALGAKVAVVWYWEEDKTYIDRHNTSMVLPGTSFVSYSREVSGQIEHAYQLWKEDEGLAGFRVDLTGKVTSSITGNKVNGGHTASHYEVNFESLQQVNSRSGHKRTVRREEVDLPIDAAAVALPPLPDDIDFSGDEAEALLPVFSGQVIQVSKVHPGNDWLFGTVLYDPLLEEALKKSQTVGSDGGLSAVLANALHDQPTAGWFPKVLSETADVNAMTTLLDKLGGEGAAVLKTPSTWNEGHQGRQEVPKGSQEHADVVDFFMLALDGQRGKVTVKKVERVQNVPLWQSYALKHQAIKTRDSQNPDHRVHNKDANAVERKWLFHGTTLDAVPKIEKQGFNRAFAGRNAVAYGKGVYFARDASFSSHTAYSEPDSTGVQRMFLCRVAVGDWCKGTNGQLTPDPKPHNAFELFDSTVDNPKNPSIFVVYHDAQAYPEYLVSFVRS